MDEIALELGFRPGRRSAALLFALFAGGVGCFNAVQALAWFAQPELYPLLHALSWAGWFFWQGVLFPRARERALASAGGSAYAAVFCSNIWPGVCWGFSHMTLPVALGLLSGLSHDSARLTAGFLAAGLGATLMGTAFRTIGFARAGFLSEYRPVHAPIRQSKIYAFMRHPLFVGGALLSVGCTLGLGTHTELLIAAVNVLILPVYQAVEDRRLVRVFGETYADYIRAVGGIAPRPEQLGRLIAQGARFVAAYRQRLAASGRFALGRQHGEVELAGAAGHGSRRRPATMAAVVQEA
ncbi:MAG TPA: methyltransferase [Gemmataceae bacterium]|nr:methyltransferase [Gemmataceae bacterium]